jgi:hypothetical protein
MKHYEEEIEAIKCYAEYIGEIEAIECNNEELEDKEAIKCYSEYFEEIEAIRCYIEHLEEVKFNLEAMQFYIRYLQDKDDENIIMQDTNEI